MEFRILGPLEVVENGRTFDVGPAKERALLAVLLLDANRVVSRDRLVAALWGETAPETAQKALQVYVSHLRKALGRERIVTRTPGYELRVEPGELDADRFAGLVADGLHDEALRLWRGSPLADFAYEPFAQAEIARLEEARLACVEARMAHQLAEGRHAAVVGDLEALVREHPLRERLRGQLMLALYRSGRQADALDVYQAGRALLADELGLEPSIELRELQRAILAHDPTLAPPDEPDSAQAATERPQGRREPVLEAAPAREVRKTVTILVCDLSPIAEEIDPETVRRMEDLALRELVPVFERHGGTVERSLTGAVTALFGVPVVHEDDALRAVRAATEARNRLEHLRADLEARWGAALDLRAAISTGEAVTGGASGGPLASGPPVRTALALQQGAPRGSLLIDERTHRLVREAVDVEMLDDHMSVRGVRAVRSQPANRFDAPMVGRARERRRLRDAFEQAVADRSCQLFTILGAPGVGKSRLVQEFVNEFEGDALVARGRCLPYGEGITWWPVVEAVRETARLSDAESADANLGRLVALLQGEEDAKLVAQRLGEVLGLTEVTSSADETFRAVRTFIESRARHGALVLVFDDIHWGEPTFLDLVDYLADETRDASVLLVCIARPELLDVRPDWGGGKLNATSALLEPLSEAESAELVTNLASAAELDERQRRRIVEAAGGNPLFVEEMLALVLEEGSETIDVPPTIQALLAARLDQLPDAERAVVEAAAVEGKVFHDESVAELSATPRPELERHLSALARRDLIRPERPLFSGQRAYRFRHLLIRDAAYESLPKEARARLHEHYGNLLERQLGERSLELDEIVGYHLEQAYRYRAELGQLDADARALGRRAAERLGDAGRRALLRSDASAGVNLISRSVALLPPDDPLRVELVPNIRIVQGVEGLFDWADRVLTDAVEAAATSGDRSLAAHALVQRGLLRLFTRPEVTAGELFDVANRAIAVFGTLDDELGLARAWRLVAQAHYLERAAARCVEASEQALAHARRIRNRFEVREIVEWLVIALLFGPTPAAAAIARCDQLLEEEDADSLLSAKIASAAAVLAAMTGRAEEARERTELAHSRMTDAGAAGVEVWIASFWFSYLRILEGDPRAAEEQVRPAYDTLKRAGETSHFSSMAHALANAVYLQGRYGEAERLTEECERACSPNDVFSQILWRSTRAKALARRGAFDEALALAREAVARGEASDFLLGHGEALLDLSHVLELAGRAQEGTPAVEGALRLFAAKGNALSAAVARDRLRQLQSAS